MLEVYQFRKDESGNKPRLVLLISVPLYIRVLCYVYMLFFCIVKYYKFIYVVCLTLYKLRIIQIYI